jgi:hypothetical protein
LGVAAAVTAATGYAQPINLPNGSFESQLAGPPFYADTRIDSWSKVPKPAYFDEVAYGFLWDQTAGVFVNPVNPYVNLDGNQAAYLLSFPQVTLFQDYGSLDWDDTQPSHAFNALYVPGLAYELTVGVFGKQMAEGATLDLSLYYRDSGDNIVTVNSTTVTYAAANFSTNGALSLLEVQVDVPTVLAGDAWANQNIGIKLESTFGTGSGYWDIDNVRLTAIPEPSTLGLMGVGLAGGWLVLRRRIRPKT